MQFEHVCVRDTLAGGGTTCGSVMAEFTGCCLRDCHSDSPFLDVHFIFAKYPRERARGHFVLFFFTLPRDNPVVVYSAPHAVTRSSASTHSSTKEVSPPGIYLIAFFSGRTTAGFNGVVCCCTTPASSASTHVQRCPPSTQETR